MISKQECILMLLRRSMIDCSESIERVSISRSSRVKMSKSKSSGKGIVARYACRGEELRHYSLHRYFHHIENEVKNSRKLVVPHYVGGIMEVSFPIKKGFATSMLQIYKPWRGKFDVREETAPNWKTFCIPGNVQPI